MPLCFFVRYPKVMRAREFGDQQLLDTKTFLFDTSHFKMIEECKAFLAALAYYSFGKIMKCSSFNSPDVICFVSVYHTNMNRVSTTQNEVVTLCKLSLYWATTKGRLFVLVMGFFGEKCFSQKHNNTFPSSGTELNLVSLCPM